MTWPCVKNQINSVWFGIPNHAQGGALVVFCLLSISSFLGQIAVRCYHALPHLPSKPPLRPCRPCRPCRIDAAGLVSTVWRDALRFDLNRPLTLSFILAPSGQLLLLPSFLFPLLPPLPSKRYVVKPSLPPSPIPAQVPPLPEPSLPTPRYFQPRPHKNNFHLFLFRE